MRDPLNIAPLLHQDNCLQDSKSINTANSYKNGANIKNNHQLQLIEERYCIGQARDQYHFFKDSNLRQVNDGSLANRIARPHISVFRRQKKIKWLDLLDNSQNNQQVPQRQSTITHQQKLNILSRNHNKKESNYKSVSFGPIANRRDLHSSFQNRNKYNIRKRVNSTIKLNSTPRESPHRENGANNKKCAQNIKFTIQIKSINSRTNTKRTKQEINKIYSPSKIFGRKTSIKKNSIKLQVSNVFNPWEFSQQGALNEFESYTQDLFSFQTINCETPQITHLKTPRRIMQRNLKTLKDTTSPQSVFQQLKS